MEYHEYNKYKKHKSSFLSWQWKYEDFVIAKVIENKNEDSIVVNFSPKHRILLRILNFLGRKPRLSILACTRLVSFASVIGAGIYLKLPDKKGDVILKRVEVNCSMPIIYTKETIIPVKLQLLLGSEVKNFYHFKAKFLVGNNDEHQGTIEGYYPRIS